MNPTGYYINGKSLTNLSLGCMRFPSVESAIETISAGVESGVVYLDTSPAYLYRSEEENCETWVGKGIKGYREQVILTAKSAVGGWGQESGYNPAKGYSITTADQVYKQIDQSLTRLQTDYLDCYHLWAVHTPETFDEALKPGGWIEGALKAKDDGLFISLGITGHAGSEEIIRWINSELFDVVTIPFNILDNSRIPAIKHAYEKSIPVLAMNPLAGGLLASSSSVLSSELDELGVESAYDMALRYCTSFPGVSALSGMTSKDEVNENVRVINKPSWTELQAESVRETLFSLLGSSQYICTTCKYCLPCPQGIWIPEVLKLRNYFSVLKMDSARKLYLSRSKNDDRFRAQNCVKCGACESRCPNGLPVGKLMQEVSEVFYGN